MRVHVHRFRRRRRPVLIVAAILLLAFVGAHRRMAAGVPPAAGDPAPEPLCIYGGSSGAIWLVQMDSVAKELALTSEQIQQFTAWADELRAETRRLGRGLLGGAGPEHDRRAAEKGRAAAALTETFHRRVFERLARPQQVRLDELYVRYLGPRALFEPRVVARLGLSGEQQQALRDAFRTGAPPPPPDELLTRLTAQQRERLTSLQGRPFAFPKPQFIQLPPGQSGRVR